MKTWVNPEVVELTISATAQGNHMTDKFDEIRVDQNGNLWAGFSSGEKSNPEIAGDITVPEN